MAATRSPTGRSWCALLNAARGRAGSRSATVAAWASGAASTAAWWSWPTAAKWPSARWPARSGETLRSGWPATPTRATTAAIDRRERAPRRDPAAPTEEASAMSWRWFSDQHRHRRHVHRRIRDRRRAHRPGEGRHDPAGSDDRFEACVEAAARPWARSCRRSRSLARAALQLARWPPTRSSNGAGREVGLIVTGAARSPVRISRAGRALGEFVDPELVRGVIERVDDAARGRRRLPSPRSSAEVRELLERGVRLLVLSFANAHLQPRPTSSRPRR